MSRIKKPPARGAKRGPFNNFLRGTGVQRPALVEMSGLKKRSARGAKRGPFNNFLRGTGVQRPALVEMSGFEPPACCVQGSRSPN